MGADENWDIDGVQKHFSHLVEYLLTPTLCKDSNKSFYILYG